MCEDRGTLRIKGGAFHPIRPGGYTLAFYTVEFVHGTGSHARNATRSCLRIAVRTSVHVTLDMTMRFCRAPESTSRVVKCTGYAGNDTRTYFRCDKSKGKQSTCS